MEHLIRLKARDDVQEVRYCNQSWPVVDGHVQVPAGACADLTRVEPGKVPAFTFPDAPTVILKPVVLPRVEPTLDPQAELRTLRVPQHHQHQHNKGRRG